MSVTQRKNRAVPGRCRPWVIVGACLIGLLNFELALAQPPKSNSTSTSAKAVAPPPPDPVKAKPAVGKQLTGAELYSINCERCHQERYPTERTGAQWKTLMLHMQVRANIPPSQARLILQFLQENSGR